MIQFLKEGTIKKERGVVKLEFKQVTTSVQSALITLATDKSIGGRVRLAEQVLKNIVEKLTISGKEYPPTEVAEKADISHPATADILNTISSLVMDEMVLHVPIKKKSKLQESPTEKETGATPVQEVEKESPQKNAE